MSAAEMLDDDLAPPLPLTARQHAILDFIRTYRADHGYAPTLREIGAFAGIRSTNGVNDHLRALERKGYIDRDAVTARSIVVLANPGVVVKADPEADLNAEVAVLRRRVFRAMRALRRVEVACAKTLPIAIAELRTALEGTP